MTRTRPRRTSQPDPSRVEELLVRLMILRRQPAYRELLTRGTGLAGRPATMRLLRAVDALTRAGDKPSLGDVADRMGIEQSNASRTVDYAVERGFIAKAKAEDDARRLELTLTEEGTSVIVELNARRDRLHRDMFRTWSDAEVGTMIELLEKLCRSYESVV